MLANILRSLAITACISVVIAGALTIANVPFLISFILSTVLQFVLWQAFTYVVSTRAAIKNKEIERDIMKEVAANSANIPCTSCKQENFVTIRFDQPNHFKCSKCGVDNVVYIQLESAAVTKPIESLNIEETIKTNELR